jgi:hypothetical protein
MVQQSIDALSKSNDNDLVARGLFVGCLGNEYDMTQIADSSKPLHIKTATNPQVFCPPGLKPSRCHLRNRTTSKAYIRPVFKEPGSKIPIKKPPLPTDVNKYWPAPALHPNSRHQQRPHDPLPGNKSHFVIENSQGYRSSSGNCLPPHQETMQTATNTSKRLHRIMGRQSCDNLEIPNQRLPCCNKIGVTCARDRHLLLEQTEFAKAYFVPPTSNSRSHNQGRSRKIYNFCDDQSDCGGSVATVSDLDYLASKSLRRKNSSRQIGEASLKLLRQEIKEMVVSLDDLDEEEDHHFNQGNKGGRKDTPAQSKGKIQEAIDLTNCLGDALALRVALESRMSWCRDSLFCNLSAFLNTP